MDPQEYKEFTVRMLPPSLFFEDSCSLLLLLALNVGGFEHFPSWESIKSCDPLSNGSRIDFKVSFLKQPVFAKIQPRIERSVGSDGQEMSWPYASLAVITQKLSRLAGLAHQTEPHLMRRGSVFTLLQFCKDRERAQKLLGMKEGSRAINTYISKMSTLDVQAVSRGLSPTDVSHLSSLSLGGIGTDVKIELPPEENRTQQRYPRRLELNTHFKRNTEMPYQVP